MTNTGRRPGSRQAALTPLLDTLFLLLFAVLATSEQRQAEVELERDDRPAEVSVALPAVDDDGAAQDVPKDGPIFLEIDQAGVVRATASLDEPMEPIAEGSALGEWLAPLDTARAVEIRADAAARHGDIVTVLHTLQESGFYGVRFIATREAGSSAEKEAVR